MERKYCQFAHSWQKRAYCVRSIRRSLELYFPTLNPLDVCDPNSQAGDEDSDGAFESIAGNDESNGDGRMELLAQLVPLFHVHLLSHSNIGHADHQIPHIATFEHLPNILLFLALQPVTFRIFPIYVLFI